MEVVFEGGENAVAAGGGLQGEKWGDLTRLRGPAWVGGGGKGKIARDRKGKQEPSRRLPAIGGGGRRFREKSNSVGGGGCTLKTGPQNSGSKMKKKSSTGKFGKPSISHGLEGSKGRMDLIGEQEKTL